MRNCKCSGNCGPADNGLTRRQFVTLLGVGTVGAMVAPKTLAWGDDAAASKAEIDQWFRDLHNPSAPAIYRSDKHTDVRFPLGGIGTGNVEITAQGQLINWQLFNTLQDGFVPLCFVVRSGQTTRLLQTSDGPAMPRVQRIDMTGQYPIANLHYIDPTLPIELSMSTFSPFAPLESDLSSLPVIAFIFKIHNPTSQSQSVSLGALMQNPVGYEATGAALGFDSGENPGVGGNINSVSHSGSAAILSMTANSAVLPDLVKPFHIITNTDVKMMNSFKADRSAQLVIDDLQRLPDTTTSPLPSTDDNVIWLEALPLDTSVDVLQKSKDATAAGATLIFSGKIQPLIDEYRTVSASSDNHTIKPPYVFDDFENGYGKWTVEGTAFGTAPASGTLPSQQQVVGFMGKGLVNSFVGNDMTTGKMTSQSFTIDRNWITFLIGGGQHDGTQIRLVTDGKVVRSATGQNSEILAPTLWDVGEFHGQTAHFEIVDQETGGWGHILVDQIELVDTTPLPADVVSVLTSMLGKLPTAVQPQQVIPFGKGRIVIYEDTILADRLQYNTEGRQKAYSTVAQLAGVDYALPKGILATSPGYGTISLAAIGGSPTALTSFTDWQDAVNPFTAQGKFSDLSTASPSSPTVMGQTVNGALASSVEVAPGATVEVPFLLAWHYPNKYNGGGQLIGNYYTNAWKDADDVLHHAAQTMPSWREKTDTFTRTFYDSNLPSWMLDCISSQISTIREIGVVFRIANGDIYGWEGSNGCCDPTCTHVWGYEQTLAHMFPDLERIMRHIDFDHQQNADGGVNNRTDVPSPPHPSGQGPFSDGHCSTILKAYREVLNSPDDTLLHRYWPHVKLAVEYLINRDAATSGGTPNGTLSDGQANTYDNTIYGVNSFIGAYYLADLRAGEEMAKRVGDLATAQRFHMIFELGSKNLDSQCWNGEYYQQNLSDYLTRGGEYGPGCLSDQLIGQWWAHQLGLGYLLPEEHVKTAMSSIFKYNFLTDHTTWHHNWRHFAGGKDKGLLICTWPKGGRPKDTIPYVDEVWTGIEYQVASHMIYEGHLADAYAVIKGARDRYDGIPRDPIPRSPWDEIECGGHYARAMSSWSILLAMSGYRYDGLAKSLRFQPVKLATNSTEGFRSFFAGPEGWGTLSKAQIGNAVHHEIKIVSGKIAVAQLNLAPVSPGTKAKVMLGQAHIAAKLTHGTDGTLVTLSQPITITPGNNLLIALA